MAVRSGRSRVRKGSATFCTFARRYQAWSFWGLGMVFFVEFKHDCKSWNEPFVNRHAFRICVFTRRVCVLVLWPDLHVQLLDCSVTAWISIISHNREINLRIWRNRPTFVSTSPLTAVPHWTQRWELCLTFALAPAKPCKFHCRRKQLWIP